MKREFSVVVERDLEGYYVASVPTLPGCHTQARLLDKLLSRVKEAIELCLEVENAHVHLRQEAAMGRDEDLRRFLAAIPDVEPDAQDRLLG